MAMHAGVRVRHWREIYGLTQLELARAARMDNTKLCRIESGEQEARASEVEALAKALGLTMVEFYGGEAA
jgi:Predicted transcription factor, homolog of eukaryotic MBF1